MPSPSDSLSDSATAIVPMRNPRALAPAAKRVRHPVTAYALRFTTLSGRLTLQKCLRRIARALNLPGDGDGWKAIPWKELGPLETSAIRLRLIEENAPNTVRLTLVMLRGVLQEAFKLGWITGDDFLRATSWGPLRAKSAKAGRALTDEEVKKLREACKGLQPRAYGAMMSAVVAVALGCGLRREELATLHKSSLSADGGSLRFMGKGRKEALQPVRPWVAAEIRTWLLARERYPLKTPEMFVKFDVRMGRVLDRGITGWEVWALLRRARKAAKLASFTPHDLRRTFGTTLIREHGAAKARILMRHESQSTTLIYDMSDDDSARASLVTIDRWGTPPSSKPASSKSSKPASSKLTRKR